MAIYTYYCNRCDLIVEIQKPIKEYCPQEKCPSCGEEDEMVRQFTHDIVHISTRLAMSEIKKVGHYAERQTEQLGSYELQAMRDDFVTKKEDKPLPPGFSKVTEQDYINMPSKKTRKGDSL
jgi:putative FmdB family regulatory protein